MVAVSPPPATGTRPGLPFIRPLYDWTMRLAAHPRAEAALAAVSFAESSFFPIPPDAILVPMVLAKRRRAARYALVCTVASVLGALAGYAIGALLFDAVGRPLLDLYGYGGQFGAFTARYNAWGAWIVAAGALTPIPFKVITIASGVTGLDPVTFTIAAFLSRGLRFAVEAALLWRFGPPIRDVIERNLTLLAMLALALLLGGFVLVRYVF